MLHPSTPIPFQWSPYCCLRYDDLVGEFSPGARNVYVPTPGGGNDIVFFRKVIGCSDYSWRPLFISSKLFGLRVEKENQYISKLAKKNEKYQNDKLYHISHVREVKESNKIVIFAIRGQLWPQRSSKGHLRSFPGIFSV